MRYMRGYRGIETQNGLILSVAPITFDEKTGLGLDEHLLGRELWWVGGGRYYTRGGLAQLARWDREMNLKAALEAAGFHGESDE